MIYGVMDIVNFAHGEFLMFGMYSSFWLFALYALDPLATLPLTILLLFALGIGVYQTVIRRIVNAPIAVPDLLDLRLDDPLPRHRSVLVEA